MLTEGLSISSPGVIDTDANLSGDSTMIELSDVNGGVLLRNVVNFPDEPEFVDWLRRRQVTG